MLPCNPTRSGCAETRRFIFLMQAMGVEARVTVAAQIDQVRLRRSEVFEFLNAKMDGKTRV